MMHIIPEEPIGDGSLWTGADHSRMGIDGSHDRIEAWIGYPVHACFPMVIINITYQPLHGIPGVFGFIDILWPVVGA
jgi:hypothetical protein